MLIPIRCFTCGAVLADKYDYYIEEVHKLKEKKQAKPKTGAEEHDYRHFDPVLTGPILDKLGLSRICCRRMMLGTEDMMDTI